MLTEDEKTVMGKAIGAKPRAKSARLTVRVDLDRMMVYPEKGRKRTPIGVVTQYTRNEGARTPSGGKFTSLRLTVKITGDPTVWVGQFKAGEERIVKLRPMGK